jgi:butirosin biosynthesis protein H-like/uncharacterized protein DUF4872
VTSAPRIGGSAKPRRTARAERRPALPAVTRGWGRVNIEFSHRRGGHCGSGCFRDLLEHHALSYGPLPMSESMAFGLSGGLAFLFAERVVLPECPDVELPLYLNGRSPDLELTACAHLGIDLDLRTTDDPGQGWRWLREELDAGRPTMVWANIGDLDYLDVNLDNTHHDVVVTGYDLDRRVASVADYDRDGIELCSLDSLARARRSSAFPGPARHATWVMRFPAALPDPRRAVETAVARTVAAMRSRSGHGAPYESGLDAVASFARSYLDWPERFGDGLRSALKLLHVFIDRAGTGGALFRGFFARFLGEAAALLRDPAIGRVAVAYRELAAAWRGLSATVRSGEARLAHAAGVDRVGRVARLEADALERLERWLAGTRFELVSAAVGGIA